MFRRRELKETGVPFLDGLLSGIERKTCWLMAELAGLERPYRMQSLLGRSSWSADELRDLVRGFVIVALGDVDGVLVVDETDFVKKGDRSVGVAWQFSGTAGRIMPPSRTTSADQIRNRRSSWRHSRQARLIKSKSTASSAAKEKSLSSKASSAIYSRGREVVCTTSTT